MLRVKLEFHYLFPRLHVHDDVTISDDERTNNQIKS